MTLVRETRSGPTRTSSAPPDRCVAVATPPPRDVAVVPVTDTDGPRLPVATPVPPVTWDRFEPGTTIHVLAERWPLVVERSSVPPFSHSGSNTQRRFAPVSALERGHRRAGFHGWQVKRVA